MMLLVLLFCFASNQPSHVFPSYIFYVLAMFMKSTLNMRNSNLTEPKRENTLSCATS